MNESIPQSPGRLVATALSGSWRESPVPWQLDLPDLDRVTPLLYGSGAAALGWWGVRESDLRESPPGEILHQAYRLLALQAKMHEMKIQKIFRLLRAAGVEPMLVKGWAMARHYPQTALRPYGDIDLLVRPHDYETAKRITISDEARDCWVDLHASASQLRDRSLDDVFARADFLTVHTPLTAETRGIVGQQAFAKMKRGVRVVNCARGGLVDEVALLEAIEKGIVAGAAIDVFEKEPPPGDHPLLGREEVIVTPHLGASTAEAQEGVAFTVAEQMRDYLLTGAVRGAVNVPALGAKELNALRPYLALAESLGRFQAQLMDGVVRGVALEFAGELVELDATSIARSFVAGLLRDVSARVNIVNAFIIAEERGIAVTTSYVRTGGDAAPAIRTRVTSDRREQTVSGTVFSMTGGTREGRITEIDGFHVEAVPRGHMLVIRNRDVPGVIGRIGTIMGESGINISHFHLGRRERGGEAMAVVELDARPPERVLNELHTLEAIISVRPVDLT